MGKISAAFANGVGKQKFESRAQTLRAKLGK